MLIDIIFIVTAFLSGSVMYSLWLPRAIYHIDIRELSRDRNPGATNAMAATNRWLGILCILLDLGKAALPVALATRLFGLTGWALALTISAPILGHTLTPWLRGRGGKGIAPTFGVLIGLFGPTLILFILSVLFFKLILAIRPDSRMMSAAIATATVLDFLSRQPLAISLGLALGALVVTAKLCVSPDEDKLSIALFRWRIH